MRNRIVLIDAGLGLLVALVLLIVSPGLAIVAILALIVLLICALSVGLERWRRRRRSPRRTPSRRTPPRRRR